MLLYQYCISIWLKCTEEVNQSCFYFNSSTLKHPAVCQNSLIIKYILRHFCCLQPVGTWFVSIHGPAVQSHVLITFRFISLAPLSDPSMVLLAPVPFPFDSVVTNTSLFLRRCDSSMADMMGVSGSVICSNVNEKNSAPDYSKLPSNKRSHNKVKEIISLYYCKTDRG